MKHQTRLLTEHVEVNLPQQFLVLALLCMYEHLYLAYSLMSTPKVSHRIPDVLCGGDEVQGTSILEKLTSSLE